ncbi:peptide/nickel transport system permease protein [Enhydrobacter aerosaccus]|uniref:Peptide/nickel transport system permease protein n=1 Tax=Enhydrobacter aerosaccus TaxID=225324 RepID=A0A1T4QDE8_9HYPH|nr:ABC transporter permease [Enhydrobacter aerosaccus]SKA01762.1 peptide/nickel transport system permease protein [Enhydrobacter aerosaccus]
MSVQAEQPIVVTGAAAPGRAIPRRRRRLRAFLRNPTFVAGALILTALVLLALTAGLLFPADPQDMVGTPLLWPGQDAEFPLGTDSLGRDVLARLVYGTRASLLVGVAAAAIGLAIGMVVGAFAGFLGGRVDAALMRLVELFQTTPTFILVIVIVSITEPTIPTIAMAIGLASWPTVARLVRAQFRSLRETDFVMAARSLGYSPLRIIVQEILPNALPPVIVAASVMIANAILTEAGLSFLNMRDPNVISWGGMIGDGRDQLRTAWFLTALPGAAIAMAVLSLNLVGDGLNEILNPRTEP